MLKVYLDWNVISYLKKPEYKELKDYLQDVSRHFVFPYSFAHLLDLSRSTKGTINYIKDLETLTDICDTNLLEYREDLGCNFPYQCYPKECLKNKASLLEILNNGSDGLKSLLDDILGQKQSLELQTFLKGLQIVPPIEINATISIGNIWQLIALLLDSISFFLSDKKLEGLINKKIREKEGEKTISELKQLPKKDVIPQIDKLCHERTKKHIYDIIHESLKKTNNLNDINYGLVEYISLALCGYSRDNKRSLLNIYSDALHIHYAAYCDLLVTCDEGMKEKAEVEFIRRNSKTQIISIDKLSDYLHDELMREYEIEHIKDSVIKYSTPEYRGANMVFKNVPHPIMGLFNCCISLPNISDSYVLRINLNPHGYIYYTELKHFFTLLRDCLSGCDMVKFDKMVSMFIKQDKNILLEESLFFRFEDWNVELKADNLTDKILPMLLVRKATSPVI